MKINDLIARGALVESAPTAREITWTPKTGDPVTFVAYIKAPSAGWLDRMRIAAGRTQDRISYRAAINSHAISFRDDDGQEWSFTYDQAYVLADDLAQLLYDAYEAVNAVPPKPEPHADKKEAFAKNTEPTPGYGTNSSKRASAVKASLPPGNA